MGLISTRAVAVRFLFAAVPITVLRVTPAEWLGIAFCLKGGMLALFALLVLPGWRSQGKYQLVQAKVLRVVESSRPGLAIQDEIARQNGQGWVKIFSDRDRDRRWRSIFRPYAGRQELRVATEASFRTETSDVEVYVRRDAPEIAYITV